MVAEREGDSGTASARLTVAICTHNRCTYLRKAMQSLLRQTAAGDSFEILVVDNGSSDRTRFEVHQLREGARHVRYCLEPVLGLSVARNRALTLAGTEFIAYLDDDAVADECWVERVLDAFDAEGKSLGCVGGKIDPIWEAERPDWLPDSLLPYLTVLDRSSDKPPMIDTDRESVFGANMAFRVEALRTIGGFDTDLGRVGSSLVSCEDSLVQKELQRAGFSVKYEGRARVGHHVPASRLSKDWFFRRAFWQGVSAAVLKRRFARLGFVGCMARGIKHLVASIVLSAEPRHWTGGAEQEAVRRRCDILLRMGMAYGYCIYASNSGRRLRR